MAFECLSTLCFGLNGKIGRERERKKMSKVKQHRSEMVELIQSYLLLTVFDDEKTRNEEKVHYSNLIAFVSFKYPKHIRSALFEQFAQLIEI